MCVTLLGPRQSTNVGRFAEQEHRRISCEELFACLFLFIGNPLVLKVDLSLAPTLNVKYYLP